MPYLRVYSLELPRELKRTLVTELTQAVAEARRLPGAERDLFTIHFLPFDPENLAIGGRLVSNGREPDYHVEYSDHDLSRRDKKKLVTQITETMSRVLDFDGTGARVTRINIMFRDYATQDFAIGGTPARDGVRNRVGRLLRRVLGRARRVVKRSTPTRSPSTA